ncbi:MAG: hypothetical protein A2032_02770 [Chloroflexi bacterium RBG_19FT_COMBO_49_13]|nr:MAG: hypothetical protein A2032_02770 [Chloroflexi bacterium RBG_19FT_COMBO_49_13]
MAEPINWKKATDETVSNLVRLIQAETVNPPGNELPAIMVVKDILEKAGFPQEAITIVESAPNRVNLVARIIGDGSERPLLMSGHVDVVPVDRERWSHDPFGGEVIDNVVWGRGAIDMKGFLAMYLQVFLNLFRQQIQLKRDVILAAVADEENGFVHGSKFLVEQHRDLIDAEYGFSEGGAVTTFFGKTRLYPIQVAEKSFCQILMRSHGAAGHGSVPNLDTPLFRMAQAIEKLRKAGHLPVHLAPTFLKMLDAIGAQSGFPLNVLIRLFHSPMMMNILLSRMKGYTRDILSAWVTNVIFLNIHKVESKESQDSSAMEINIGCRLVPGQTAEDVKREIQKIVGAEVELEIIRTIDGTEFSIETPLYKLLEKRTKRMDPGGLVVPMLFPAGTDACYYQNAGITVYGFTPGIMPPGIPVMTLAHGHDERLPISFIESGLPVLWDVVNEFCAK